MAYKTLYRVFRPAGFGEVYGQQHITDILKRQVADGKASHAYLFYGPRGTGKTSTAKIFANALNCLDPQDGEPCGKCDICTSFQNDNFVDIVEIDAASNNGVDNVRDIREKVSLLPAQGKYKVYIIDEVHMLSTGAFNALLKTLEEPPPHAVFILATTESRKVPPTILSRCQKYDFKRITEKDMLARMEYIAAQEGIAYEKEALELIARQAEGAMRDALSIMDQCVAGGDLTLQAVTETVGIADSTQVGLLAEAVMTENAERAVTIVADMLQDGVSAHNIMRDLINVLSAELAKNARDSYQCANILRSLEALIGAQATLRYSNVPGAVLNAAVVRAAVNTVDVDTADMELRVKKLEQRLEKLIRKVMEGQAAVPAAQPVVPTVVEEVVERVEEPPVPDPPAEELPKAAPPQEQPKSLEMFNPAKPARTAVQDEDAKQKLAALKNAVLGKNMMLFPAIDTVRELEVKGNKLLLHIGSDDAPVAELLTGDAYRAEAEAAVQEVFGQALQIELVFGEHGDAPPVQGNMQQDLIDLFGADNVNIIED